MRFLVDECSGPAVADWLREAGHDVYSIFDADRGIDDQSIIQTAYAENRILITIDKDFGDKVYRDRSPHCGIVLMRLENERSFAKIDVLRDLLENYADQLQDQFVVVTESRVRFAGIHR